jgi:CRISPR-associated endoribonuclease Cas6
VRVLIELSPKCSAAYSPNYTKLQGFIYNLVRKSPYGILHDKKTYKFFCFSNIFPIGDFKQGDKRYLLISSPDSGFINVVSENLNQYIEKKDSIHIGDLSFSIESVNLIKPELKNNVTLITATPIILRIPKANYEKYGINSDKEYVFWRPSYPFEAFVKQLEDNIFKKYKAFYGQRIEEFPIFEIFNFKKSTVSHVLIDNKEYKFFGSIWEFVFSNLEYDKRRKEVLKFAIDCGFGERNTFGFGFVNILK